MTTGSPTIAISVSPNPAKGTGSKNQTSEDGASAFSISLEVAREEAGGETGEVTTSITVQGLVTDDGAAGGSEGDVTIEIETVVFSGDNLAENLSASTVIGGGSVAITEDGSFGVNGSVSGENEIRLEVGETLTFELPPTEGEVIGGQVTITNLFSDGVTQEGALVFAYDADDQQLACYCALGNETGSVTIDVDVPFARLDFKALDNDSLLLEQNSNVGVGEISALFASIVEGLEEGASQLIDDIVAQGSKHLAQLVDLGHFGKVHFEISRVAANQQSTITALGNVRVDQGNEADRLIHDRLGQELNVRESRFDHADHRRSQGYYTG